MHEPDRSDWDGELGDRWTLYQQRLDRWLEPLGAAVLERLDVREGERVLDVGCGCGASTLALAERVGRRGRVVGLDLSHAMLGRAAARARAAGLDPEFRVGDAEVDDLEADAYDVLHSRFGVMFFAEPTVAFARLRRSLRTGGRLGFVCWQARERNDWATVPARAVERVLGPPEPSPDDGPGPFAFADRDRLRQLLDHAGFDDVAVEPLDTTLDAGSVDEAYDLFGVGVGPAVRRLMQTPEPQRTAAQRALRDEFERLGAGGRTVRLSIAAWLVTATA